MTTDAGKKKTILVCGDLVSDTHIARLQLNPTGYSQPHLQSQLATRRGGAWYLREMVDQAIKAARVEAEQKVTKLEAEKVEAEKKATRCEEDLESGHQVSSLPSPQALARLEKRVSDAITWAAQFEAQVIDSQPPLKDTELKSDNVVGVAKAFSVWEWFGAKEKPAKAIVKDEKVRYKWSEGEAEPGAWRIKEFLGCQQPRWPDQDKNLKICPILPVDLPPDLLVIDDLGLGFAKHDECWPACLSNSSAPTPGQILAKVTPPFGGRLWKKLLEEDWASRLTVVVSVTGLRSIGARLSRGFSWDQTIREVQAEFAPGGVGWVLRNCHRVVVTFGHSGTAVFSREPRSPGEVDQPPTALQFERFVFDPAFQEGTWSSDLPGTTFGATSVMTAALAAWTLANPQPSSHLPVSRGLAAARELHRTGGGHNEDGFHLLAADSRVFSIEADRLPEAHFRSAFPRTLLDESVLVTSAQVPPVESKTLLTDALGFTSAFLTVAAQDIVYFGKEHPLKSVPRLEYGKYFTVDREEIERLNTVRNLIIDYLNNSADKRPLSLAVFGPPGSGKSFAIKELSQALFGKDRSALEFNLSQFEDLDSLHEAFQEVRDQSVQHQIPLVFWDEFDSMRGETPFGWLKEFLAPMQDVHFLANGKAHPFGKCIFIFAGGTSTTFAKFTRTLDPEYQPEDEEEERGLPKAREQFKETKGPDFVSRLRGYVNIKGPNPTSMTGEVKGPDEVHVIRRALLLRSLIEKHHKDIIPPGNKCLAISPTVLDAFLKVKEYRHGARSMEAIVSLSRLRKSRHFGPSELPAREVAELHVSPDFFTIVEDTSRHHLSMNDIDCLAEIIHDNWRATKKGYEYDPHRDDDAKPPTHPLMRPYLELTDEQKEGNRLPARLTTLRLEFLGYDIVNANHTQGEEVSDPATLPLGILARSEHRRWMREKLLKGVAFAAVTSDDLLLHKDLCEFDRLGESERDLDDSIVKAIFNFLENEGLVLVRRKQN